MEPEGIVDFQSASSINDIHDQNSDYANIRKLEIEGKKIALLGINSAWMCGRRKNSKDEIDDKGVAVVGEPQIHDPLEDISEFDIKIAVLHHPFDWLADFESSQIMSRLMKGCNFILRGHQHEPLVAVIRSTLGDCIVIPAGSCYDRRTYANAYNFVHLDFNSGKGVAFLRCWNGKDKWREDIDSCSGGKFEFHSPLLAPDDLSSSTDSREDKLVDVIDQRKLAEAPFPIPRQIPPPPSDFKGREEEISDILANFDKGATITGLRGMGGVGKTALALVLANKLKNRFPDGQIFLNLFGTDKNTLASAEAMSHVIRSYYPTAKLPDDLNGLGGLYRSVLADKRTLLLLDNAASREQVQPLVPPAGCALLITSRIKFTLPGLKESDLDVLPADKARELLLEISWRIGDHADELSKLCGHLPLALRNAGSALAERKDLDAAEYERRLREKMTRLELVDASFNLSYELLSPIRKKQWGRLSVFPEDFDRDGAAAVWKMGPDPSAEALSDMVKWSIVDFNKSVDSDTGRYRLHDLARLFAESRLDFAERVDAQQSHAKHYMKVLSNAEKLYNKGGKNILAGLELFDREWINIKIAQAWIEGLIRNTGNLKNEAALKLALKLADTISNGGTYVLNLRLQPTDRIRWFGTSLGASHRMKHRDSEGSYLMNLGLACSDLGESRKAVEYYVQALTIARKFKDLGLESSTLNNIGIAYSELGEARKAIKYYEQSLEIVRKTESKTIEGDILCNLGRAHADLSDARKAIEYYDQSLEFARKVEYRKAEGEVLFYMSLSLDKLDQRKDAIDRANDALRIFEQIESPMAEKVRKKLAEWMET